MDLTRAQRLRLLVFAHPIELALSVAFAVLGFPLLVHGATPGSVSALLPSYAVWLWGACLALGGLLTGLGLLLARWWLERSGLLVLTPAIFGYAVLLGFYQHWRAATAVAVFTAVGLGLAGRMWQHRQLERFESLYRYYLLEREHQLARGVEGR